MSFISIVLALLCLAVLIGWHELGHFVAARACGVHVLRFSIGFGKAIWSWTDGYGTRYILAAIPFGGYVRMLGEDDLSHDGLKDDMSDRAFSAKPIWQRLIIVLAGPFANVLLTFLIFTVVNLSGITQVKPVIGSITPDSPSSFANMRPGEQIVSVDGVDVSSWSDVSLQLVNRMGDTGSIVLTTEAINQTDRHYDLNVQNWLEETIDPDPIPALGIVPFQPVIEAVIDTVQPDGAAAKAGLQSLDRVLSANGNKIDDWRQLVNVIRNSPSLPVDLMIERQGQELELLLLPSTIEDQDETVGFAGISTKSIAFPEDMLISYHPNLFEASGKALVDTIVLGRLIIVSLYKLVTGDIALGNLSGPIGIVKIAGQSASSGVLSFLLFAAYISVSLGILNLLPIPVLDGGQAMFLCIEWIIRREIPEYFRSLAMRLGIIVLVGIMLVATVYDIYKL